MGIEHNRLAHAAEKVLLSQVRRGEASWAPPRLSTATTLWHGTVDWPQPDGGFQDATTKASLAVEFKPPNQPKREYVTGLGQVQTYLDLFEFALLVTPALSQDGYEIARYLARVADLDFSPATPIGIISYESDPGDEAELKVLKPISPRSGNRPGIPAHGGRGVFWAYWRDLSAFDVLQILTIMDRRGMRLESAFADFWRRFMLTGKSRLWDGSMRSKKSPAAQMRPELTNADMALRHIHVVGSDGNLTDEGLRLLRTGKVYGYDSIAFLHALGRLVLIEGRHLDLILWTSELQRSLSTSDRATSKAYRKAMDLQLQADGVIPHLPSGKGKETFIRDELKLWNALGLLHHHRTGQYFHPGEGLAFDWRTIMVMAS